MFETSETEEHRYIMHSAHAVYHGTVLLQSWLIIGLKPAIAKL